MIEPRLWIDCCRGLKSDGAGAYAGMVFSVGLSMLGKLTGIRVTDAYTGESGKNKTTLDDSFAGVSAWMESEARSVRRCSF
jgi:hypothetical protein